MRRAEGCKLLRLSKEAKKCKRDREIHLEIKRDLYITSNYETLDRYMKIDKIIF